jgi:hypothetical protein
VAPRCTPFPFISVLPLSWLDFVFDANTSPTEMLASAPRFLSFFLSFSVALDRVSGIKIKI